MAEVDWRPVLLSLRVAPAATLLAILLGLPLAWLLARRRVPFGELLGALLTLPLVVPPTVLGYGLLLVLGRRTRLGGWLEQTWGVVLVFDWPAAVLAGALAALPLFVRTAQAAFEGVDRDLEDAARTLGCGEGRLLLLVTLPLAARGVTSGAVLAFARAFGEFGATLMVAGNIPGRTQTLPTAIYDAVQAGQNEAALLLVLLTCGVAGLCLMLLNRLGQASRD
ncbi:MAG: molybdate ABC transporter permease subunit [Armatimonadetes bacterium]|nr:molybdate ABC transporter permease subunit [Armatimonadota bacterium]